MATPNLKLSCLYWSEQIPNGHRLATFEEVGNHIKTSGIQRITKGARAMARGEKMHFLDGYLTSPDDIHAASELYVHHKVVVTAKERDKDSGTWRANSSAYYSSDGVMLRDQVYDQIHLSPNARQIALRYAMNDSDPEILYWLLKTTTSSEELNHLKSSINRRDNAFDEMVACLLSSVFPLQLPLEPDSSGNTAIDYAIRFTGEMMDKQSDFHSTDVKNCAIRIVELLVKVFSPEIVHWKNKNGMSFLDMAEKEGLIHIFTKLLCESPDPLENDLESIKPRFQAVLLEAVQRGYVPLVEKLLGFKVDMTTDVHLGKVLTESRDSKGRTLLHIAASNGNKNMVDQLLDKLLSLFGAESHQVAEYVKETYSFRRTALHMACGAGHREIVQVLLQKGKSDPLKERDVNGNTALHYAAQGEDPKVAKDICQLLIEHYTDFSPELSLLLWASAGGIGTADEGQNVHHSVKKFLKEQKALHKQHLLRTAAMQENVEMAWELLNRGADIDELRDPKWEERNDESVKNVLHELESLKERGRDNPSMQDNLGRNVFAEGLAALFLNRFIESPITVGICGEWGMGKSSLMIQTENILQVTAAQLTFPNLLKFEDFEGAKNVSLGKKGRKIYQTIKRGASCLFVQEEDGPEEILQFKLYHKVKELVKNFSPSARHRFRGEDPLVKILQECQPQYRAIYKSLACMDIDQLLDLPKRASLSHGLRQVPRILTIQYNAWHYRDENEAWAGLAITVTKEIEKSMTRAQWFSTCWRYNWNNNNVNIYFEVFLPCFFATFLAGWFAWGAWILLEQNKFKDLKYGSIPLTIIVIVWTLLKSVISVVKPVSVQMLGYITLPDHTNRLGYQEQVISDINFLKKELGERPHWFFSLVSGEWCWDWFGFCANNVENSTIRKFKSASEDQLRIITFVDDLDRCEEKVILKVLSAVNLVLARCKINVVMGIDKQMIERAIKRNFQGADRDAESEDNDLPEKFLCKIIQIPLSLPDPTEEERNKFLEHQLGCEISSQDYYTDYGTPGVDVDEEDKENSARNYDKTEVHSHIGADNPSQRTCTEDEENSARNDNTVVQIDYCNPSQTSCSGIIKKAAAWFICPLRCFYSIACNISSELKYTEGESNGQEMCPLAFSKGARLTREMLISNYSKEEAQAFDKLKGFATGNQKLPREWKRLLNYHKLAWNILYKRGDVHSLPKWKVQLVVWIFVCWQWKHEMNTLIKGWSKFAHMDGEQGDGTAVGGNGPPLSQIVKNCVHYLENAEKSEAKQGDVSSLSSWKKLIKALRIQDVSMKGIQVFQQFRFHCETDNLPWPVDGEMDDEEDL